VHQTFYIDIDEEITSIIERLRKSAAKEVVIVVPKRALLIQSIINLKLLKREADKLGKEIIIVTQDKLGKLLVEKTGIAVELKLNDIAGEEMLIMKKDKKDDLVEGGKTYDPAAEHKIKNHIDTIGSSGFFDNSPKKAMAKEASLKANKDSVPENEKLTNKELVTGIGELIKNSKKTILAEVREKTGAMDMVKNIDIKQRSSEGIGLTEGEKSVYQRGMIANKNKRALFKQEKLDYDEKSEKEIKLENSGQPAAEDFHQYDSADKKRKKDENYKNINLSKKSWKFFAIFGLVATLIILISLAYVFLPKATITIFAKTKIQSLDAEMKADTKAESADFDKKIIPAKAISVSEEISRNFDSTGNKSASSRKARGMITIYNEYSSANQPLVATTRFVSEDGKLFRLINGITVPGLTKEGTEIKPGAIEAEVTADEAGEEFNIEPTKFTIPGFQGSGSEKYAKIYAKSFKTISGGAKGSETVRSVTDADISSAKSKILAEFSSVLKQKIKEQAGQGYIILDEALSIGDPNYKVSNSTGEISDKFTVTLKISGSAIVFKETDLNSAIKNVLAKGMGNNYKIADDSIITEFGKSDADFENSALTLRLHATGKTVPDLNLTDFKRGSLGKNSQELDIYLKTYPDIARVEVDYWPTFISGRIPAYASRVDVVLDNN